MKTRAPLVPSIFLSFFALAALASFPSPARAQVNLPPEIAPLSDLSVDVGQLVLFAVHATDPEGNRVDLTAAGLPAGARFDVDGNGNGSFFWIPTDAQGGSHIVTFIATDRGTPMMSAYAEVTITVNGGNRPPVLDPIGDQEGIVGMPVSVPLSATDPDGDPLTFSVDPILNGSLLQPGAPGESTFEWVPSSDQVGNHVLTFTVSDGLATDEETIVVTIGDVNVPPILEPIGDRTVDVGGMLEIALLAGDADDDGLVFDVEGLPEGAVLQDAGDGTALLQWMPDTAGFFELTVTVTDDGVPAEAASETFTIEVLTPPPVFELELDDASWTEWPRPALQVMGHGAPPGAPVEIRDAISGMVLRSLVADVDGSFAADFQTLFPPCSVDAHAADASAPAMEVRNAPKDCSGEARLRVWKAFWICLNGSLQVWGDRAPAGATLRLYDDASGELLALGRAGFMGHFRLRTQTDEAPATGVQIGVELDGVEWMLGPFETPQLGPCYTRAMHRGHRRACRDKGHGH